MENLRAEAANLAAIVKRKNVIDMAITFTAMIRVFEKGSKKRIVERLRHTFEKLEGVPNAKEYRSIHDSFCVWFTNDICTAERKKNGRIIKRSGPASYGQAAKILDISMKVYVYYCSQPTQEISKQIIPFLNGAVDTPILNHLKSLYPAEAIKADTIESVDKETYNRLQASLSWDIATRFDNKIYPVQYDDIMWNQLNR